jgi:hypothetical protein
VEEREEGGVVEKKVKFENLIKRRKVGKWTNLPT